MSIAVDAMAIHQAYFSQSIVVREQESADEFTAEKEAAEICGAAPSTEQMR